MEIKTHVLNLSSGGRLHPSGGLHTPASNVAEILSSFQASGLPSLTLVFHGGLVGEREGLEQAMRLEPELGAGAESYPLFVVWESGALEILQGAVTDIVRSSPLFMKLMQKLIKHVARKLPVAAPDFEAGPGETRAGAAENVRAQVEAEQLPPSGPSALELLEPPRGAPVEPVSAADEEELARDLAGDPEAARALEAILQNAPGLPPGEATAAEREPSFATGYLDGAVLAGLRAQQPPPGVEALPVAPVVLWKFAGGLLSAVINRYRNGTQHGLAGTVLEEMYRALYADKVGAFLWERIKRNAREAYADNPPGAPDDSWHGGTLLLDQLRDHIAAHGPVEVNLVGHSAGSIHICHFVERAAALFGPQLGNGLRIKNILLSAPACTCELFMRTLARHEDVFQTLRVYDLADDLERDDPLVKWLPLAYPHSLLYLVSGLLEAEGPDTALLGLARHVTGPAPGDSPTAAVRRWFRERPAQLVLSRTDDNAPPGGRAAFSSHYGETGPLGDHATLQSMAALIRPAPARGLTALDVEVTADVARLLATPPEPADEDEGFGGGPLAQEIVIGENEIVDHALLKGLLQAGRAVARIVISGVEALHTIAPDQRAAAWQQAVDTGTLFQGHGTGWVFGRAGRLLITNNHVIPLVEAARTASAEFGYERDLRAGAVAQLVLKLQPDDFFLTSPNIDFGGLDFTLVALSRPAPAEIGFLEPLQGVTAARTTNIFVVQHPNGNPKAYVLSNNKRVSLPERYVTYVSDTLSGSSGSPLFDDSLRLVGIHHVGNFKAKIGTREEQTNLGSRIEEVVREIVAQLDTRTKSGAQVWSDDLVRMWFGEGPVLTTWQQRAP